MQEVKGLVMSLLALKPEDRGKSMALEIAAGGKLYNVTIEDELVGKGLLALWDKEMHGVHPAE